jgi:hypothetical protein
MRAAARAADITDPELTLIEIPAGSRVFHTGGIWHGSGLNTTGATLAAALDRRSHDPENAEFSDRPGGYIWSPYQKTGDASLDESFFPGLSCSGRRTDWIEGYCANRPSRPPTRGNTYRLPIGPGR